MRNYCLCCLTLALMGTAATARGEIVNQLQTPFVTETFNAARGTYSQFDTGNVTPPNLRNFATVFDNFTFANSGVVDSLSWAGLYDTPNRTGASFVISLYTSLGATAGAVVPIQQFTVANANETAVVGIDRFYTYSTTATPFTVTGGTNYWLSIVAQYDFNDAGWGWAFSALGDDQSVSDFGDTSLTRENLAVDFAMRISTVPEPRSGMFLLSFVGWAGFRRNRKL